MWTDRGKLADDMAVGRGRQVVAAKNRSPDCAGRPLSSTQRSAGLDGPVFDVQPPFSRRPRGPAVDPMQSPTLQP